MAKRPVFVEISKRKQHNKRGIISGATSARSNSSVAQHQRNREKQSGVATRGDNIGEHNHGAAYRVAALV